MLQPRKTKYRKSFRGKMRGMTKSSGLVTHGDFGLQTTEPAWISANQLEAARKAIVGETKRRGKVWMKVFPHKPYSKKPAEVRMGSGKGDVAGYVAVVKPGRVMFEISGLPDDIAKEALRKASTKLPVKCQIISREIV